MGSLCPRPIFCFPWFVQKKNRKDWGFFFPGCAALGTDGVRSGVSSLSFPTVGRGRWHRARGDLGGMEGLWGSLLPLLLHFVAPPSSSITAHCSASSTSSLKHFPFIFILWRGFKSAFTPSKTTRSPDHGSVLSPETPKLGFPWAGAAGREGSAPPWHPHPVLPLALVPSGPFPSPRDLLARGFSKISPKILQFLPHERFHPSSFFPCRENLSNEDFPEQGSYRFKADLIKAAGRGTACFKFMGNTRAFSFLLLPPFSSTSKKE